MSIVSVHGPNTFGSKAIQEVGPVQAVVNPNNGLIYTFALPRPSGRPAADFAWAFPGGTPVSQAASQGPVVVTYAGAGAKTATLTVSGASGLLPVNGVYPITVQAVGGVPTGLYMTGPGAGDLPAGGEETADPEVASTLEASIVQSEVTSQQQPANQYDPAENTVMDVLSYAKEHPDQVVAILEAEQDGKERSTLISGLQDLLPYDPADHTVKEVMEYVEAHPENLDEVLSSESVNKNRSTLIAKLIEFRDSTT